MKYLSPIEEAIASAPSYMDSVDENFELDSFTDDLDGPDEEELAKIAAEESKSKSSKNAEDYFSTELEDISYIYHIWRKKAEKDGKRKPIHSDSSITCPVCGKVHNVKSDTHILHKTDLNDIDTKTANGKILYSLLRLYDFATICTCEKFLYGHYQEPVIPKWLAEALGELDSSSSKDTSTKKGNWEQLSFEDIYDADEVFPTTVETETVISANEVETVTMEVEAVSSDTDLLQQLSDINVALDTFCKEKLVSYASNPLFASLSSLKTALITAKAKLYSVLNFARMNNNEKRVSIGLIQIMLEHLPSTFDEEQKLSVAKILARTDKTSSETELKSLSFFSEEEVSTFMENITSYKVEYDELQELTKNKMDLSKACIWGKSK
jgi:hypothetical protein